MRRAGRRVRACGHTRGALDLPDEALGTNRGIGFVDGFNVEFDVVAEQAVLTHIRLQEESAEAFHINTVFAEVAERIVIQGGVECDSRGVQLSDNGDI